jgi:lipid-binding SYLF domain-containing protein
MRKKNFSLKLIKLVTLHTFNPCKYDRFSVGGRSFLVSGEQTLSSVLGLFLCCLVFLPSPSWGFSNNILYSQEQRDARELVAQSDAVLYEFLQDPNVKWLRKHLAKARGILIVPQMFRGTFLIGKSGGPGVLLARDPVSEKWSYPGFYTIDSVSTGLQIGADASEIILLIMTEQGMKAMLRPEFTITSRSLVAAGPNGDERSQLSADILAYGRSMKGIISGVSLTGSVITPQSALTTAFYGRTVSMEDVLVHQRVSNYKAGSLRRRIKDAGESLPFLQK